MLLSGDDLTFVQFIRFLKTHNRVSEGVANILQVKGAASTKVHASHGQAGVAATAAEEVPASKGLPHSGGWAKPWGQKASQMSYPPSGGLNPANRATGSSSGCPQCGYIHHLEVCRGYLGKTQDERKMICQEKRLCFWCLGPNHMALRCQAGLTCGECGERHHYTIHGAKKLDVLAQGS